MSTTDGADLDASTFDLDKWIDDIDRPSVVVELYPNEAEYQRRIAEIEAALPAAEKSSPDSRGIGDATPETLMAEFEALRAERERSIIRVRVRQLIDVDILNATKAAKKAGAKAEQVGLWTIAAATVHPDYEGSLSAEDVPQHFTAEQLYRMGHRNRSGAAMVAQLADAANSLVTGLPVPSSPGR